MVVTLPTTQTIAILLILVPGYAGIKIFKIVGKVTTTIEKFEKTLLSVIVSTISVSVLYITYAAIISVVERKVKVLVMVPSSIEYFILLFIPHLFISIVIGAILGYLVRTKNIRYLRKDITDPSWDYFIKEIHKMKKPVKVRISIKDGADIQGYIGLAGTTNDMRDVLLVHPEKIEGKSERSDEKYMYIKEDSIRSVSIKDDIKIDLPGNDS